MQWACKGEFEAVPKKLEDDPNVKQMTKLKPELACEYQYYADKSFI